MREYRLLFQHTGPESFSNPEAVPPHGGFTQPEAPEVLSAVHLKRLAELQAKERQDRDAENPDAILNSGVEYESGGLRISADVVSRISMEPLEFFEKVKDLLNTASLSIDDTVSQYLYTTNPSCLYIRCQRPDGSVQVYEFRGGTPRLSRQAVSLDALEHADKQAAERFPNLQAHIDTLVQGVRQADSEWTTLLKQDPRAEFPKKSFETTFTFFASQWDSLDEHTRSVVFEQINSALSSAGLQDKEDQMRTIPMYRLQERNGELKLDEWHPLQTHLSGDDSQQETTIPNDELPDDQRVLTPQEQAAALSRQLALRNSPGDIARFNRNTSFATASMSEYSRSVNSSGIPGPGERDSAPDASYTNMTIKLRPGFTSQSLIALSGELFRKTDQVSASVSPSEGTLSFLKLDADQVRIILNFVRNWQSKHAEAVADTGPLRGIVTNDRPQLNRILERMGNGPKQRLLVRLLANPNAAYEETGLNRHLELAGYVEKLTPRICENLLHSGPLDEQGRDELAALLPTLTADERKFVKELPIGRQARQRFFPE